MPLDVIVGIPTLNEEATISHVVEQIDAALAEQLGHVRALIVNFDGHSADATRALFVAADTVTPKEQVLTGRGKGDHIAELIRRAALESAVAVTIDGDLASLTPLSFISLLEPILDRGVDCVLPLYESGAFGPLTATFAYPACYGWFGADVRQPIAGEFALSSRFVGQLASNLQRAPRGYGIDFFLTTEAVCAELHIHEVQQGPKRHRRRTWSSLGPMAAEVFTTAMTQLRAHGPQLRARTGIVHPSRRLAADTAQESNRTAPNPAADKAELSELFASSFSDWHALYAMIFSRSFTRELARSAHGGSLDHEMWARAIATLVAAGATARSEQTHLSSAAVPLLYGRLVSHLASIATHAEAELAVATQASSFLRWRDKALSPH